MLPSWHELAVYMVFIGLGATSIGWPGLYLAEVARLSPAGQVSTLTAGSLVFTNSGKIAGPLVFANVFAWSGSYSFAFATLALPTLVAVACLARTVRLQRTP